MADIFSKLQSQQKAMGLYRIPIRHEKVETVPRLMQSIGFPVVRTENREDGVHYFCANPKRSNKNWTFCISREKKGGPQFFMCGLSQLSKQIVGSLNVEGLFDRHRSE
ncbi:hypothetical protein [Pseudomonas sp.]|jgi:hypothetical protein|uniref:hypothetical protein n=1 Tax=Pseudomonas sp. TaxID=306 RepID=UPI003C339CBB